MGIYGLSFLTNNRFFKKTIVLAELVVVSHFVFKKVSIFILDFHKGEFMVCIMNLMVMFGNIWKYEIPQPNVCIAGTHCTSCSPPAPQYQCGIEKSRHN
jgi:hypothetical protein